MSNTTPADRIDELYTELRDLTSRQDQTPELEAAAERCFHELRRLQEQEADAMEERFKAGLHLLPGEGWAALKRAQELLDRHEDLATADAAA